MSKTISINAGSSSLKWQLYQMPEETVLAKGLIERIGLKDSISTVKFDGRSEKQVLDIHDHTQAVKILLDLPVRSGKQWKTRILPGIAAGKSIPTLKVAPIMESVPMATPSVLRCASGTVAARPIIPAIGISRKQP